MDGLPKLFLRVFVGRFDPPLDIDLFYCHMGIRP